MTNPPDTTHTLTLSNTDRSFLKFALDLAFDHMCNHGDEFGDDDRTALANLRRLADNEQPAGEDTQARRDAQDAAAALRQAADLAHAEGVRLYDDMGQKAAEGAWAARDRLRARVDEISGQGASAGGEQA